MGTVREAALRLRLIDQFTGPGQKILAGMAAVDAALKRFGTGFGAIRDGFNRGAASAQADFARISIAAAAMAAVVAKPVRAAIQLEDAMDDVAKVSGLSGDQIEQFRDQVIQLSRETPMAASELAGLAVELAAAGVPDSDLLEMTKLVSRVGVAFGITGEQAGENLGKIRAALNLTTPELVTFSDQVNALSDATASEAADLLTFTRKVGSLGNQAGFSTDEVLAFGSAIISAGAAPEVAATGFAAMVRNLNKGTAATAPARKAWERLGLTSTEVAKSMQEDAVGTVEDIFKRLKQIPEWERGGLVNQLFGDEARPVLALIENSSLLADSLKVLADEGRVNGSVLREFEKRISTTSGKLRQMRNRAMAAGIAFGNALLPSIRDAAEAFGPYLDRAGAFVQANEKLVERVAKVTAGMVAARLAASALRVGVYALLTPSNLLVAALGYLAYENFDTLAESARQLMAVGEQLANSAFAKSFMAGAGDALDKMASGARALASALAEFAGPGSAFGEWLNSAAGAGWGKTLGEVAVGLAALAAAGAAFGAISGPLKLAANAILLISGIKPAWALVRWIRSLSAATAGLAAAGAGGAAAAAGGGGLLAWLGKYGKLGLKGVGRFAGPAGLAYTGYEAGRALGDYAETPEGKAAIAQQNADDRRRMELQGRIEQLNGKAQGAMSLGDLDALARYNAEIGDLHRQLNEIGQVQIRPQVDSSSIDRALDKANALRAALAGAGGSVGTPPNTNSFGGPRASGGPVQAGKTYLVGERGPEPFVPGRSGTILPNSALGGVSMVNHFHLHGKATEEDAMTILQQLNHLIRRSSQTMYGGAR